MVVNSEKRDKIELMEILYNSDNNHEKDVFKSVKSISPNDIQNQLSLIKIREGWGDTNNDTNDNKNKKENTSESNIHYLSMSLDSITNNKDPSINVKLDKLPNPNEINDILKIQNDNNILKSKFIESIYLSDINNILRNDREKTNNNWSKQDDHVEDPWENKQNFHWAEDNPEYDALDDDENKADSNWGEPDIDALNPWEKCQGNYSIKKESTIEWTHNELHSDTLDYDGNQKNLNWNHPDIAAKDPWETNSDHMQYENDFSNFDRFGKKSIDHNIEMKNQNINHHTADTKCTSTTFNFHPLIANDNISKSIYSTENKLKIDKEYFYDEKNDEYNEYHETTIWPTKEEILHDQNIEELNHTVHGTIVKSKNNNLKKNLFKSRKSNKNQTINYSKGFITAIKKNFGFICPVDGDDDIYFHFSNVADITSIHIGDDVEFLIVKKKKSNRKYAIKINTLPKGSINMDQISENYFEGNVIKSVLSSCDNSSNGIIRIHNTFDSNSFDEIKSIIYSKNEGVSMINGDKKDTVCLEKGDLVKFQVLYNKKTKQRRAVNICLIEAKQTKLLDKLKTRSNQEVFEGIIDMLDSNNRNGLIKMENVSDKIWFSQTQLESNNESHVLKKNDQVSFCIYEKEEGDDLCSFLNINEDHDVNKIATNINIISKNSMTFDKRIKNSYGVIDYCPARPGYPDGKIILNDHKQGHTIIHFDLSDTIKENFYVWKGDIVSFDILTGNQLSDRYNDIKKLAKNIKLVRMNEKVRKFGIILSVSDSVGIIKSYCNVKYSFHILDLINSTVKPSPNLEVTFNLDHYNRAKRIMIV